jgi:hypothetical protein
VKSQPRKLFRSIIVDGNSTAMAYINCRCQREFSIWHSTGYLQATLTRQNSGRPKQIRCQFADKWSIFQPKTRVNIQCKSTFDYCDKTLATPCIGWPIPTASGYEYWRRLAQYSHRKLTRCRTHPLLAPLLELVWFLVQHLLSDTETPMKFGCERR